MVGPPRKRLTRQESKEATRARLVDAAEKVFISKGFDDVSVEEIPEAAGYSGGAFYSNFAERDEPLTSLEMDHRFDEAAKLVFDRRSAVPARDPE